MTSPLWYWHYRLKSRPVLNAKARGRELEGVLLRDAEGGHACIQPWPDLGDPPLQKCLDDLAGPRHWPIVRRALRCMEMDGAARSVQDPLFDELEIPQSHATLPECDPAVLSKAIDSGFSVIKLKCGRDLPRERRFLTDASSAHPALTWRLDFNETGDADEIGEWLMTLPTEERGRIEFLEDPSPYSPTKWRELFLRARIPLAVDREAAPRQTEAGITVIKPAIDEPWLLAEAARDHGQRVIVTSYMDHPLGQAFAAWEAGRLALQFPGLVGVCGLQTHHLFEPTDFTEALGAWSPDFHPPPGKGLGFDDLLDRLPWKRLC